MVKRHAHVDCTNDGNRVATFPDQPFQKRFTDVHFDRQVLGSVPDTPELYVGACGT